MNELQTQTRPSALRIMAEKMNQVLQYNENTGVFTWLQKTGPRCRIGHAAGSETDEGYIAIRVFNKNWKGHRLAWFFVHGCLPTGDIDHINGDKRDNRISNLRIASCAENCRNSGKRITNKSGYKGVCWHRRDRKWRAQICHNYKVIALGSFQTREEAAATYIKKAMQLHGEYFNS